MEDARSHSAAVDLLVVDGQRGGRGKFDARAENFRDAGIGGVHIIPIYDRDMRIAISNINAALDGHAAAYSHRGAGWG